MCYTVVKYVEYACGHKYVTVRTPVDCGDEKCVRSRAHLTGPHDCQLTCAQERLDDQGLVMEFNPTRCASCHQN